MGVYVSRGDACAGRPFYECLDCAGASALYYDDELNYWFVGPNGCGSLTVAMYVVDAARSPDLAAATWREWDGSGWSLSNATLSCLPRRRQRRARPDAGALDGRADLVRRADVARAEHGAVVWAERAARAAPDDGRAVGRAVAGPSAAPAPAPRPRPPVRRRRPRPRPRRPRAVASPVRRAAPRPTPAPRRGRPAGPARTASWHQAGKPSRGCAYVAGKASRCSKEDADGVSAADACERACGRCDEPAACEDSASWYAKKAKKDCDYVAEQPEERCGKKGLDAIRAIDACPAACGACDDDCADSASWYSKKSKKDCAYVAADPGKRCSKQGQGSIRAEDACPAACGACDTPAPSSAAVDAACADSSSWTEAGRPSRGCAYVADKPSEKRCGKEDESGVLASAACAAACGACGPPPVSPFG
ncbi:cupin-like domain-containing protein [Aureococcus anophagefferens]|nr:cupin-like domain-containing protein [Aureococcus anophagefferens]